MLAERMPAEKFQPKAEGVHRQRLSRIVYMQGPQTLESFLVPHEEQRSAEAARCNGRLKHPHCSQASQHDKGLDLPTSAQKQHSSEVEEHCKCRRVLRHQTDRQCQESMHNTSTHQWSVDITQLSSFLHTHNKHRRFRSACACCGIIWPL
jgi:hypothetical protein